MEQRVKKGDRRRAIGVVRVSTSKQDVGAAAQRAELVRWAEREGVELVAIFEDVGVSGSAPLEERPGLIAAIAALREHRCGRLVAVKRDRFARHRHTIADVERAVARAGGVLVTTDGACSGDDTEAEELAVGFQDLLATMELRKIRARNLARARQCIADGRIHGGDAPYGFRRREGGAVGRSGRVVELEPDPGEQAAIARMRALRDEGLSLREVGEQLEVEGLRARGGRAWQAMSIKRVLARTD